MIHVICGLIGAGKSTYAMKKYKHILEYESFGSKELQIRAAKTLHETGELVAYITCYPTSLERLFFDSLPREEIRYFLIDTSFEQCAKNIVKRGRFSDNELIETGFEPNRRFASQYAHTDIPFERITVFTSPPASEERW